MRKTTRTMVAAGVLVMVGWSGLSAMTPEHLRDAVAVATASEGDVIALEVSVEGAWDDPIIAIELDNGREVYVATASGEILSRERTMVGWGDRQVAAAVRDGEVISLEAAWPRILQQLAASERHSWVTPADVRGIEYDTEFRRRVIEVALRRGGGDEDRARVYADATTGAILEVEYDD
ncbi:MAG TPA: hypothetical protein VJ932_11400 [Alkalispirochaeta sp.]|nr:hypothetical protein [Alkalispirochaeta sp.]